MGDELQDALLASKAVYKQEAHAAPSSPPGAATTRDLSDTSNPFAPATLARETLAPSKRRKS